MTSGTTPLPMPSKLPSNHSPTVFSIAGGTLHSLDQTSTSVRGVERHLHMPSGKACFIRSPAVRCVQLLDDTPDGCAAAAGGEEEGVFADDATARTGGGGSGGGTSKSAGV